MDRLALKQQKQLGWEILKLGLGDELQLPLHNLQTNYGNFSGLGSFVGFGWLGFFKPGRGIRVFAERKTRGKRKLEVKFFNSEDFC